MGVFSFIREARAQLMVVNHRHRIPQFSSITLTCSSSPMCTVAWRSLLLKKSTTREERSAPSQQHRSIAGRICPSGIPLHY